MLQRTSRISTAPKDHGTVLIGAISQHLVQLDGKAVQVANVQWAEISVECVVQQALVNSEVDGRVDMFGRGSRAGLRLGRALRGRLGRAFQVLKWRVGVRWVGEGGQVEAIWIRDERQKSGAG